MRPRGFSAAEFDRGPTKKFEVTLDGVGQGGLRSGIVANQTVLRAEWHTVRNHLDGRPGGTSVRLQKAEPNNVAGKSKFKDRLTPLNTGLVDGDNAALYQVKLGFGVAEAEQ